MTHLDHLSEEELIAFHLGEGSDVAAVRTHLEGCPECAAVSASIAETLRVFSAGPVPQPDLERNWQRLRGNLSVLSAGKPARARRLFWPAAAGFAGAAGLGIAAVMLLFFLAPKPRPRAVPAGELAAIQHHVPLTAAPADPEIARQLESAERLLTEVNHAAGPLDETTRTQAHELLLKNAVYIRSAHDHGDLGTASVLENLGRVLTNIDHEPEKDRGGWHLRFEMNTDGLLLDIRILRQNDLRQ